MEQLPELMKRKPLLNEDGNWWFDRYDFDRRIKILDDIIKSMSSELRLRDMMTLWSLKMKLANIMYGA